MYSNFFFYFIFYEKENLFTFLYHRSNLHIIEYLILNTFYLSIISILSHSLILNVLTSFIFISLVFFCFFFLFFFLGFSEFSGAMCARGVTGLDDLHTATNEFLGHFVDVVYQFQGDGKIHISFHICIYMFIFVFIFKI